MKNININELIVLLNDQDWYIRYEAVNELIKIGDKAVIPYLIPLIQDHHWQVRDAVAEALVSLNAKEIFPELIALLNNDINPDIICNAVKVLGELSAKESIPKLIHLMTNYNTDDHVRFVTMDVLVKLGVFSKLLEDF